MRIEVVVKMGVAGKVESNSKLDLVVGVADTVASVKDRVADVQLIPFPEKELLLNGISLQDGQPLSECGVKERTSLDLVVTATEKVLLQQLSDLLQTRDLSCDELSLLYCYKHGVSVTQALKIIGQEMSLAEFLQGQKTFKVENNHVVLVRESTKLKPFSIVDEVEAILQAHGGSMDVKELSKTFVQKFNVSLSSIAGGKPTEFLSREKIFTVKGGSRGATVALTKQLEEDAKKAEEAASADLIELPPGLENGPPKKVVAFEEGVSDSQQYLDLHQKISGRAFNSKVSMAVAEVVEVLSETSFLNIDHFAKAGSVGKGTSISGTTDAEIVVFLKALPPTTHERWLPSLLKAVAGVLTESMGQERGIQGVRSAEDCVHFSVKGLVNIDLRFSPVFDSYTRTIETLANQSPDVRRFYMPALVEQRVQFIARQPSQIKITIRLLKWWRDQQDWSSKLMRPTDEILELIAVYSGVQTKPSDTRKSIANVMSLLSRFNELRIVWSNYYNKGDVWAPLLKQRPLLMDPVNPFVNIADPQAFDATELMSVARTTHFFW